MLKNVARSNVTSARRRGEGGMCYADQCSRGDGTGGAAAEGGAGVNRPLRRAARAALGSPLRVFTAGQPREDWPEPSGRAQKKAEKKDGDRAGGLARMTEPHLSKFQIFDDSKEICCPRQVSFPFEGASGSAKRAGTRARAPCGREQAGTACLRVFEPIAARRDCDARALRRGRAPRPRGGGRATWRRPVATAGACFTHRGRARRGRDGARDVNRLFSPWLALLSNEDVGTLNRVCLTPRER